MDTLKQESIEWAVTHIRKYGDTDIFPIPFEYEAIKHSWQSLKDDISKIDIATYEGRPFQRMLVPKQSGGYRVAIQLDPIDTIVYTALAYEAAELVEASRIPLESKVACSYRVEIGTKGELFRKNNGWDDFHTKSQELAQSGEYSFIVTADIADFFNQIGHHRVRNALELAGVEKNRAKNIENLLMNFTRGQSRGIPIGPSASAIFSEACLSDVDNFLLRKGYTHTRYVDDFRLFCKDQVQAQKVLHDLTEYLYTAHRLALQTHKTQFYSVNDFIDKELIDPEELENKSQEEKLEALHEFFGQYQDPDDVDEPDIDSVIRKNLVELFQACLNSIPIHLGTAKYLLRRATTLRTGLLRDVVLNNIDKLAPVMREAAQYISATTNQRHAAEVGRKFISGCLSTDYEFLPFVQIWLLEVLQQKMSTPLEGDIAKLCEKYKSKLGQRPYALLARERGYNDWVREQKETWLNNSPWDRRAIIWAAKALSNDEMNYWLKRVQNAGDILDKAIAESVLNTKM
ncbi:RNA-directed DNA polymerase [Chromobacterium aquaticum]|uniref:Reverse transcriptase domain-containing protein n=1 Tax=Chromobacterium aquaticum TaxID=467180 RepID=A0ABV8ZRX7_9NEIS|nr:RNA-directed DNA polymerase [Chromobacterium aquaticum]MCD5360116.1 RNA-directed DNA polymerase [Chromobacterium aquaticum]